MITHSSQMYCRYVMMFLSVKDQYAPAHKLMAQILERSTLQEDLKKAIHYYKRSFELDETQKQLTLKSMYKPSSPETDSTISNKRV